MRPRLVGLLAACLIVSASASGPAQKPASLTAVAEIEAVKVQLANALHAKQLDEIPLLYAPDGSFLTRTTGRVTGRPAIRELFEKVLNSYSSNITLKSLRVEHSDDLAYDSGDFEETVTSISNGKQYQVKGNYLMVFRRGPGGTWLIVEQVMTDREQAAH